MSLSQNLLDLIYLSECLFCHRTPTAPPRHSSCDLSSAPSHSVPLTPSPPDTQILDAHFDETAPQPAPETVNSLPAATVADPIADISEEVFAQKPLLHSVRNGKNLPRRFPKKRVTAPKVHNRICLTCQELLVTPKEKICQKCGGIRFTRTPFALNCRSCRHRRFFFEKVIPLGRYHELLRRTILDSKRRPDGTKITALAELLFEKRRNELLALNADMVIPVPMFFLRRFFRGVNLADLIAAELARQLRLPLDRHAVRRVRSTYLQSTMTPKNRFLNVSNAFEIVPSRCRAAAQTKTTRIPALVKEKSSYWSRLWEKTRDFVPTIFSAPTIVGKRILLVDDILTTGATCNEISRIMLEVGASAVFVAVLARAEGKEDLSSQQKATFKKSPINALSNNKSAKEEKS